jgi:hypothetical protein
MIVRISTEGQFRVAEDQLPRLQQLDAEVVAAAEAQDATRFERRFAELLSVVRAGEVLDDAHLSPSDAILPPPGTSLSEAVAEFSTDGLIPTLPL